MFKHSRSRLYNNDTQFRKIHQCVISGGWRKIMVKHLPCIWKYLRRVSYIKVNICFSCASLMWMEHFPWLSSRMNSLLFMFPYSKPSHLGPKRGWKFNILFLLSKPALGLLMDCHNFTDHSQDLRVFITNHFVK